MIILGNGLTLLQGLASAAMSDNVAQKKYIFDNEIFMYDREVTISPFERVTR